MGSKDGRNVVNNRGDPKSPKQCSLNPTSPDFFIAQVDFVK